MTWLGTWWGQQVGQDGDPVQCRSAPAQEHMVGSVDVCVLLPAKEFMTPPVKGITAY